METNNTALLLETKSHGSKEYPIEYYENLIPDSYIHLQPHWHKEFEISKIQEGMLTYRIGQNDYIVQKGDILIITPDTLHSAHQLEDFSADTRSIVFHPNLVGLEQKDRCTMKYIEPFVQQQTVPFPVIKPDHPYYEKINQSYQDMWELQDPHEGNELLVKAALFQLFFYLWKLSPVPASQVYSAEAQRNIDRLKPVLTYIHLHFAESLTIEQLASISGFSSVHFMNIFKKVMGSPCMEYVLHYRINAASHALKETDHSITKIALENGFQNIPYFNRCFKSYLGCTPTQYRRFYQK